VFRIATNVAMDDLGRKSKHDVAFEEAIEPAGREPAPPAFEELEPLTANLPPTERAAVVLRYGYDLPYAEIGAALGSSEEAARAAASSGVRRLRRSLDRHA
jgi:DNA-directed RNA polymerase specialized sigma24 family protein